MGYFLGVLVALVVVFAMVVTIITALPTRILEQLQERFFGKKDHNERNEKEQR